jgi:F0F1-type ATP synthase membrane subunit b/b'
MRSEYESKLAQAEEQVIAMQQQGEEELARTRREVLNETRQELAGMRENVTREIRDARQQAILQHRVALGELITALSARMISEATADGFQEASMERFIEQLGTLSQEEYRQAAEGTAEEARRAQLVSARELPAERRARIEAQVERLAGQRVEIVYRVDAALVAGATLRFGDVLVDGSLTGQLERLRERYVSELEQGAE